MDTRLRAALQSEREARFLQNMDAFMHRDFAAIEGSMRSDVVLELPGTSWLAGGYRGYEDVSRCIVRLRRVFDSEKKRLSFLHEGDQMIVVGSGTSAPHGSHGEPPSTSAWQW